MELSEEQLRSIAKRLRVKGGYWGTFTPIEALMGWLKLGGKCVYCGVDLVHNLHIENALGCTDHLLPKSYTELDFLKKGCKAFLNCVPACSSCNGLKHDFDANDEGTYIVGAQLTEKMQSDLINKAKAYVDKKRSERLKQTTDDRQHWDAAMKECRGDA